MKATTIKKAALVAGSLSFLAGSAFSQTAISGAGGYETVTINGGGAFTVFGQRLHQPIVTSGEFDSQTAGSLSDSTKDFTAILTAGTTYLVEITGPTASEGTVIEATTWAGSDITGLSGIVADDATNYTIRAATTINDLLGATNSAGLTGSTDGSTAGVAVLYVPDGASFNKYFYLDIAGSEGWLSFGFAPAGDVALNYVDGLIITEPGADKSLVVTGMVKTSPTVLPVTELFNYSGTVYPVGSTLGNSGLSASVTGSTDGSTSAVDVIYNPKADASGFDKYFYLDIAGSEGWLDFGFSPSDDVALASGVIISQGGTGGPFNAKTTAPPFYANL